MADWNAIDGFESGSDINLTDWNGGSNWVASSYWGDPLEGGSSTDYKIDTSQVKVGSRAVHVDCSSGDAYIQRNATEKKVTGSVYFAFRAAQTNKSFYYFITNSGGSGQGMLEIRSDGNVNVMGSAARKLVGTYSADTWYYANVEWGASGIRARMGTSSWGSYSDYDTITTTNIEGWQFEHYGAAGVDFWVDDIRVTDPFAAVVSPSASVSASLSPSASVSASLSPSTSVSASIRN